MKEGPGTRDQGLGTLKIKKAMLFAAGRGERLRPLTDKTPKPLLPLGERPLIDYSLFYLKRYGIEEVIINLWHLGEKIEGHVGDGKKYGLKIIYSKEKELLGTGGGLKKVEGHFKNEKAFITLNSDTLIDCDLNEAAHFHFESKTPATLVVAPWQEGYTRIQVGGNRLLNIGAGDHLFSGLGVLTPLLFSELSLKPSNLITDGIFPLMQKVKSIAVFVHNGYWLDIGTLENYKRAQEEWASSHYPRVG